MSQEKVDFVRAAAEDFYAHADEPGREAMLTRTVQGWDPEVVWDASALPLPDLPGVARGSEEVRRWWGRFLDAWQTVDSEFQVLDAEDRVVTLFNQRMRGRSTGIEMPLEYGLTYTFRDGLIVHMKVYASHAEALEAVGLRE